MTVYAEDVSGSGRRKINQGKLLIVAQGHTFYFAQATLRHMHTSLICQGFLTLVALDAREQPYQLLAVAAADAEERTLHLPHMHMPCTRTHALPLHLPLYRSTHYRTRRSYGASCAP